MRARVAAAHYARIPKSLTYVTHSFGGDKPNGAKARSSGKINLPSSQAALMLRAAVATDAKPRAEISSLNLCRGAKEENCKLTDAFTPRRQ